MFYFVDILGFLVWIVVLGEWEVLILVLDQVMLCVRLRCGWTKRCDWKSFYADLRVLFQSVKIGFLWE